MYLLESLPVNSYPRVPCCGSNNHPTTALR